MTATDHALPSGFEALEPFVATMATSNAQVRYQRRIDSSVEERETFYLAAKDLVQPGLALLDLKPFAEFDDRETRLMYLLLAFCHISQAIECQKELEASHAKLRRGLTIVRASATGGAILAA